ncbi:MAG: hypothetical protein E3K36_00435 [Candidatus Brocadia sp.]|nr:hypothetical protein [Candidatus Brocadia sp.]
MLWMVYWKVRERLAASRNKGHCLCRLRLRCKRLMFLMQFDHKMFKGFPVSIPMVVFMAEIKIVPQPLLMIIMNRNRNRFFIHRL